MQHELTAGELLDDRGHLREAGFARSEVKRYRRSAIGASWFRIKEWDYYCALADDYGVALTVADNGYMGLLSASWLDLVVNTSLSLIRPRCQSALGHPFGGCHS